MNLNACNLDVVGFIGLGEGDIELCPLVGDVEVDGAILTYFEGLFKHKVFFTSQTLETDGDLLACLADGVEGEAVVTFDELQRGIDIGIGVCVLILAEGTDGCAFVERPSVLAGFPAFHLDIRAPFQGGVARCIEGLLLHEVPHGLAGVALLGGVGLRRVAHTIDGVEHDGEATFACCIDLLRELT